jgi:hypothetical protein
VRRLLAAAAEALDATNLPAGFQTLQHHAERKGHDSTTNESDVSMFFIKGRVGGGGWIFYYYLDIRRITIVLGIHSTHSFIRASQQKSKKIDPVIHCTLESFLIPVRTAEYANRLLEITEFLRQHGEHSFINSTYSYNYLRDVLNITNIIL